MFGVEFWRRTSLSNAKKDRDSRMVKTRKDGSDELSQLTCSSSSVSIPAHLVIPSRPSAWSIKLIAFSIRSVQVLSCTQSFYLVPWSHLFTWLVSTAHISLRAEGTKTTTQGILVHEARLPIGRQSIVKALAHSGVGNGSSARRCPDHTLVNAPPVQPQQAPDLNLKITWMDYKDWQSRHPWDLRTGSCARRPVGTSCTGDEANPTRGYGPSTDTIFFSSTAGRNFDPLDAFIIIFAIAITINITFHDLLYLHVHRHSLRHHPHHSKPEISSIN
ncbi:hypothetical protein B0O80DRAFT_429761 [Mortierella sp. GBAus27b]|nr:hypothetical protein B0O80DRAFT_429761 [Mortierella sp. GBAus27b]